MKRMLALSALALLVVLGGLTACQHRILYYPRPYDEAEPAAFLRHGGKALTAQTRQGSQTAWFQPAAGGLPAVRLWIVCAGNGSLALDLSGFFRAADLRRDAFLFVDYPGYGKCEGSPGPRRIRESLRALIPLAAAEAGIPEAELPERGLVFGHSLGAACALLAADEFQLRRAVLLSPFTSTMDMAAVLLKMPLGFLVYHRFDNAARLRELAARDGHAWIFHGVDDEVIPLAMSRELAAATPSAITLTEVPGGRHNTLLDQSGPAIIAALRAARTVTP